MFIKSLHLVLILSLVFNITSKKSKHKSRERNLQINCSPSQFLSYNGDRCVNNCQIGEYISLSGTRCLSQCNAGQYISSSSNQCLQSCGQQELYFESNKKCTSNCGQGFFKSSSNQVCVGTCSQGEYISVDTTSCLTDCQQGQFKATPNNCLTQCPPNQFVAADNVSCITSCSSIGQLISAASQSRCVTSCSGTELLSSDSLSCTDECIYTQFSSGNQCYSSCPGALFGSSQSRSCVSICPTGFYAQQSQRICKECHSNCQTCSGQLVNQCLSCHSGATFDQITNRCVSITCQPGSFLLGTQCQACSQSCLQCNSLDACTSCYDNFSPQQDGSCITCKPNQYYTATGCKDCPVSYDLVNLLAAQEKASALASCQIKMNKTQVESQINTTLQSSLSSVSSLNQASSSKDITQTSHSFVQLSLQLVSKLQDTSEFFFSNDDLAMAAQPIKDEDFSLQLAQPTATKPNPSKIAIPRSIAGLYIDAKVVAMQCNQSLFNIPSIGTFQPPVLSLDIRRKSKSQSVQSLAQPIKLTMFVQATISLQGVFYNPSTSSWSNQGIQTSQRALANGIIEVQIATRHLTSFSVRESTTSISDKDMQGFYIALGLSGGLVVLLLIIAQILDCVKRQRYYPHEKLSQFSYNFKTVFGYSLLYNLPLISLCSYRDRVIPNFAKALCLTMMYVLVIVLSFFFYLVDFIYGTVSGINFSLIWFLALFLMPNSLFIRMISIRVDKSGQVAQDESALGIQYHNSVNTGNTVNSINTINTLEHDEQSTQVKRKPKLYIQRKVGAVLFFFVSIVIIIVGFTGIYFMGKKIVDDRNQGRLMGILGTFIGSVIVSYVYGLFKQLIGSYVAMNAENSGCFTKALFLDVLTQNIAIHFKRIKTQPNIQQSIQRRVSVRVFEEKDEPVQQLQSQTSKKPSKKKKKKKNKSKQDNQV